VPQMNGWRGPMSAVVPVDPTRRWRFDDDFGAQGAVSRELVAEGDAAAGADSRRTSSGAWGVEDSVLGVLDQLEQRRSGR